MLINGQVKRGGEKYRYSYGISAEKITTAKESQPDLFSHIKKDAKQAGLFLTIDRMNTRCGLESVKMSGLTIAIDDCSKIYLVLFLAHINASFRLHHL
ncbi:MAG: hypothetical protein COW18_09745 [Zetaproteobacteria bacterium CG12_big_fil_rev_8_21_14_0_65_54_13]|nr:MAG: hypothetical protein COX55_00285 [Zetaproteobacteria bacterium CG23_combo_of_CG06-09_8_20_14_all_54_7]PIW47041.1 MAG: hypothetical protein COW18_09745 [Zetaproteobacteria bacterium CG12_big_fil_rev_8_21_14_0_65_54_13]PIX53880.1 MAG: hypothetical protein COZ50_10925 [Zetaproteobacteria bacterium CG_4_10_14_3_um_filter_54_28]PJA28597.1 MAG: hypothetical protein CO188_08960 [Zetaproteobacteria bacterium CG_4_9_14_3_um_filter_54_145]